MPHVAILLTHGTDTLSWTLPYIRYAIKNNHANICLTGSQIPLPAVSSFSDAYINLENSMRFLSCLAPPNVFAVFNYGRDAFSDSLRKVHRWDCNAFIGDRIATMESDDVRHRDEQLTLVEPFTLDRLHVVSTGGTIDSEPDEHGILSPGENHALRYLSGKFSTYFRDLSQDPVFAIDSSDMTFVRMETIARTIASCLQESFNDSLADCHFDHDVRIVYTDPFKTEAQYRTEVDGASGIILAGYGGGNINIEKNSGFSPLSLIRNLIDSGIPVVLSSQVPRGRSDFLYQNGAEALRAGAIPSVDLSIPECQLRLSFLLGHLDAITTFVQSSEHLNLTVQDMIDRIFLSGVKFRNRKSRSLCAMLTGVPAIADDLLIDIPFDKSLERASRVSLDGTT